MKEVPLNVFEYVGSLAESFSSSQTLKTGVLDSELGAVMANLKTLNPKH